MKTKRLSLVILSLLTVLCLAFGVMFLIPKLDVVQAEGEAIVVEDNFKDITTKNHYYEKSNMCTNNDDMGDTTMGYIPVYEWGSSVKTTDGYMTYKIKSDKGYVFDTLSIEANVGIGHEGGLYYWQTALSADKNYVWPHSGSKAVLNFYIYVSADNENWTPALYSLDNGKLNADNIKEQTENNIVNVNQTFDATKIPSSNELYIKFYFEHPENDELPVSNYANSIGYDKVGLMFAGVKITATQDEVPSSITVSDDFNVQSESKEFIERVNMISEANKGHATYGFVPSTGVWDGSCHMPDYSYLTYKLQASKGCYITALNVDLYATLAHWGDGDDWANATVVVQASYDNLNYFDLYDLRSDTNIVDTWIDGKTYYGAKGTGCLNGYEYLNGVLSGMTEIPDTTNLSGVASDVRYQIDKIFDNTVINKTDLLYIRIACKNKGGATRSLAQCPTRVHNLTLTINQEALPGITISDDMTTNTAKTPIAIKNMVSGASYSATMYNSGYGWVPAATWGDPAQGIGSGSLTYLLMADPGAVLDEVSFSMVYKYFLADASKHSNGAANILVNVSTDGKYYVPAFDAFKQNGIDTSTDDKNLDLDLTSYAKGSPVLYIKIELICPEDASLYLSKIPVTIKGVSADATQKFASSSSILTSIIYGNGNGAKPSGNGLVSSSGVVDGNATFALIPTATWGGTVNTGTGELIYKVSAGEGKKLGALSTYINAEIMNGANIILSLSEDNVNYTEMFDVIGYKNPSTNLENTFAYATPYKWHRGSAGEERSYQKIAVNFGAITENLSEVYVKIQLVAPVETIGLQGVKVKVFSLDFFAPITARQADTGYISYVTFGGINADNNPTSFVVGDQITLSDATKTDTNFAGWYDNASFEGDPITVLDTSTVKDYKLYAKYDSSVNVNLTLNNAEGLVTINGATATSNIYNFDRDAKLSIVVAENADKIFYSFVVDGVDTAISNNTYTVSALKNNLDIVITYNNRAEINDYFNFAYDGLGNTASAWKQGAYDYSNLKMITFDGNFALGVLNTSSYGYITYKVVAPEGKRFEAASITLRAKLSNFTGAGRTEDYYVDYYIGYEDGIANNYANYNLLHQAEIGVNNSAYNKIDQFPVISEIEGKEVFYIQIRIRSASENWLGLRELTISDITYQSVQVLINYGASYSEYYYSQLTGVPFDASIINVKDGFIRLDDKVYTDAGYTVEYDVNAIVNNNLVLYVKVANGYINYVLNGGENAPSNKAYYESVASTEIADPTYVGKTFAGWYFDQACTELFTGIEQGRTGDITLYAKWVDNLLVKISSASLTLGKDITLNYYAVVAGQYDTVLMRFTMNGIAVEVAPVLDGYSLRFDFENIAPQHMGDNVKAELIVDGVVMAEKDNYSILTYCNNILADNPSNELATLVADVLEYGAMAQLYTKYKTDALVNEGITGKSEFTAVSSTDKLKETVNAVEGFDIYSAGVYFYYSNNVYVKFNAGENFKITIDDVDATDSVQEINDGYILYSDMISATNFDKVYTFKLYSGETLVQTFSYSIKSFVYSFQKEANTVADLAKALYNYGLSANAYIKSLEA